MKIKMNCFTIFVCHFLLFAIALALPANKIENKKPHHDLTTMAPAKDLKTGKKEATSKANNKLEKSKSVAKKRDIQQDLLKKLEDLDNENPEDPYGGKSAEEYAKVLALRPYSDNSRVENAVLKAESYGDPASMTEYRYYGGEDRKKRTAMSYNRPTYSKRELSLTTDDVIALLSLMQQQQPQPPQPSQKQLNIYNPYLQSQLADFTNSLDFQENDLDDEDIYNESPENRYFDDLYPRERFPQWGNFAKEKRFMVSKKNAYFPGRVAVPIFRRAVL